MSGESPVLPGYVWLSVLPLPPQVGLQDANCAFDLYTAVSAMMQRWRAFGEHSPVTSPLNIHTPPLFTIQLGVRVYGFPSVVPVSGVEPDSLCRPAGQQA